MASAMFSISAATAVLLVSILYLSSESGSGVDAAETGNRVRLRGLLDEWVRSKQTGRVYNGKQKTGRGMQTQLLRQELAKESGSSCLARLLCGPPKPPNTPNKDTTNSFSLTSDYGLLVKEFLDIFSDDPTPVLPTTAKPSTTNTTKKPSDDEDDDEDDEAQDDDDDSDEVSLARLDTVKITASLNDEEVNTNSTSSVSSNSTVSSITTGATITELPSTSINHRVMLEEVLNDDHLKRRRRRRKNRRSKRQAIQPQCREFSTVATDVLTTCPLTTEVIRYFNSNLKNGTQIALLQRSPNTTDAGLVVLNDAAGVPHPYFLDHSPPILAATSKGVFGDLKNPSVGGVYPAFVKKPYVYERAKKKTVNVTVKPQQKTKKKKQESSEEEEEEEGDDLARSGIKKKAKESVVTERTRGLVSVYGVPQPSIDNEFSLVSAHVGVGNVLMFDDDDSSPTKAPPPKPLPVKRVKPQVVEEESEEEEEEEDEDEEEEEEDASDSRSTLQRQRQRYVGYNYARQPFYGAYPAPRPEEYYPRIRPQTQQQQYTYPYGPSSYPNYQQQPQRTVPTTMSTQTFQPLVAQKKTPVKQHNVRARLNFMHAKGANLLRPPASSPLGIKKREGEAANSSSDEEEEEM